MEKFPLTKVGFAALEAELKNLKGVERPNIIAAISAAVAYLYAGSGKKPVIKSVKKSSARRSAFATASLSILQSVHSRFSANVSGCVEESKVVLFLSIFIFIGI